MAPYSSSDVIQRCVLMSILPWVHCYVVHYPHSLSTQISAGECCSKSNTLWFTYRKLRWRQPPQLVTRPKNPALNGEQKTSTALLFNNYNPTILQYVSAAGAVVSVAIKKNKIRAESSAWLHYRKQDGDHWVRKVNIVAHATFLPLWGQHLGPSGTLLFATIDIGTPWVLKLSIVSVGSMDIGTRHKSPEAPRSQIVKLIVSTHPAWSGWTSLTACQRSFSFSSCSFTFKSFHLLLFKRSRNAVFLWMFWRLQNVTWLSISMGLRR